MTVAQALGDLSARKAATSAGVGGFGGEEGEIFGGGGGEACEVEGYAADKSGAVGFGGVVQGFFL